MGQLTGSQLFLRYAWPCAEDKLNAGKISEDDFFGLEMLVKGKLTPPVEFLTSCFPEAVEALRKWTRIAGFTDSWSIMTVTEFWRYHHGHSGNCAVNEATICDISSKGILVITKSKSFIALNIYDLDLQVGENVFVHRNIIIEKDE